MILPFLFSSTIQHMALRTPGSRWSNTNTWYAYNGLIDYTLTTPLNNVSKQAPCKGYAQGPFQSRIKHDGTSLSIFIGGSAIHGGGNCQFGIMKNHNWDTAVVLMTVLENCLVGTTSYTMPLDLGSVGT
jgi:hypothetical protein